MTKKEKNDAIYKKLMEHRKRDPKHYGLSLIGASYEDVRRYEHSKVCVAEELREMKKNLSIRIEEVRNKYSIASAELRAYLSFHNYSLSVQ